MDSWGIRFVLCIGFVNYASRFPLHLAINFFGRLFASSNDKSVIFTAWSAATFHVRGYNHQFTSASMYVFPFPEISLTPMPKDCHHPWKLKGTVYLVQELYFFSLRPSFDEPHFWWRSDIYMHCLTSRYKSKVHSGGKLSILWQAINMNVAERDTSQRGP